MFGTNLVIPAKICVCVTSYRVDKVKLTDKRTDTVNDNTPLAQKAKG